MPKAHGMWSNVSVYNVFPHSAIPSFCESVSEFLEYHRSLLESDEVSANVRYFMTLLPCSRAQLLFVNLTSWDCIATASLLD